MDSTSLALYMVKTGTSRSDLIQHCGVFKLELDNMLKGKIPVKQSVAHFLIERMDGISPEVLKNGW